jgi:transcriptional regulator with XRE-family HTH domain
MSDTAGERQKLAKRIGQRIAEHRKALGWTQDLLAEHLDVDAETISRFERGVTVPALLTLDRLAHILKTRISSLLDETAIEPSEQAVLISAWLAQLSAENEGFVVAQIKALCEHLRRQQPQNALHG